MSSKNGVCIVCLDNKRSPENNILICDHCKLGYHQKCHKPLITDDLLDHEVEWMCRRCLYTLLVKDGEEELISRMKKMLPYDLASLQWDSEHRVNQQNTYCYCGAPGEFHAKMLQCRRCWQWFHGECIAALKYPLLFGDHYYLFTCCICNDGDEILTRIEMDFNSMLAIVLNNLSLTQDEAFFSVQNHIVPFIKNHCRYFELGFDWKKLKDEQLISRISSELQDDDRFVNSVKTAFNTNLWGLKRCQLETPHGYLFNPNKYQFKTIKELSKKTSNKIKLFENHLKEFRTATSETPSASENVTSEQCPRDLLAIMKRGKGRGRQRKAKRINGHKKRSYAPSVSNRTDLSEVPMRSRRGRPRKLPPKINGGKTSSCASIIDNEKDVNNVSKKFSRLSKRRNKVVNGTSSAKLVLNEATVASKPEPVNGLQPEPFAVIMSQKCAFIHCHIIDDERRDTPPTVRTEEPSQKKTIEMDIGNQEKTTPRTFRPRLPSCLQS